MGGSLVFSNTRILQFRVFFLSFFGKKKKAIPFALFFFLIFLLTFESAH